MLSTRRPFGHTSARQRTIRTLGVARATFAEISLSAAIRGGSRRSGNGGLALPAPEHPIEPRSCYICKRKYSKIHDFYDQLCQSCATLNLAKRTELADLRGRVALLTGGRVKIGYQAGLKLLRSGAHLIVTTRFPRDSASRYAREPDFGDWADRLEIFGLDLRHVPSVEAFCAELLATRPRLDVIINNDCQTVRRPPDVYAHMMAGETASQKEMPETQRALLGARRYRTPDGAAPTPRPQPPNAPRTPDDAVPQPRPSTTLTP